MNTSATSTRRPGTTSCAERPAVRRTNRLRAGSHTLLAACALVSAGFLATAGPAAAQLKPEPGGGVEVTNFPTLDPSVPAAAPAASTGTSGGGLDGSSAALGGLAGIALAGAGLGITLGVQRRRDHSAIHTA